MQNDQEMELNFFKKTQSSIDNNISSLRKIIDTKQSFLNNFIKKTNLAFSSVFTIFGFLVSLSVLISGVLLGFNIQSGLTILISICIFPLVFLQLMKWGANIYEKESILEDKESLQPYIEDIEYVVKKIESNKKISTYYELSCEPNLSIKIMTKINLENYELYSFNKYSLYQLNAKLIYKNIEESLKNIYIKIEKNKIKQTLEEIKNIDKDVWFDLLEEKDIRIIENKLNNLKQQ